MTRFEGAGQSRASATSKGSLPRRWTAPTPLCLPRGPADRPGGPTEPTLGDGLLIVERDGERYEFWTRTVEREPGAVVAQRVLLQPAAFLLGFLALVAGAAVGRRGRLGEE